MKAERRNAVDASRIAIEQTSGTLTTKDLRRMRHPFARRQGAWNSPIDPGKANDQGGGVPESWEQAGPTSVGRRILTNFRNVHPDALWLSRAGRGKSTSVARPISAAIKQRLRPIRADRLRAALRAALQPTPK